MSRISSKKIIVKVTATGGHNLSDLFLRQTAQHLGIWGDCHFFINQDIEKCDWWIVCHVSALKKKEKALCDPDHIVFMSMEPDEGNIPACFFNQFSKLVLCDRKVKHPDIIYQNALTWWVGILVEHKKGHSFSPVCTLDYDKLTAMDMPTKKNRISVICSNKKMFPGHQKRLDFIAKLQAHPISKHIDFYGGGFRSIPDKWNAIAPYQYHLVLENSVVPDYWTEKLADAFLGFSFPVYYGCPNIEKYFPPNSLQRIDIEDFDASVKVMETLINKELSVAATEEIIKARSQVLRDYNIFQLMAELCAQPAQRYQVCCLKPPRYFMGAWVNKCKEVISSLSKRVIG